MDTTDPDIYFDGNGNCNHCNRALNTLSQYPFNLSNEEKKRELDKLIQIIKKKGKKNEYDCLVGISGGVDSTYITYLVKRLGLRPLAIHLDNLWNTKLSEDNIKRVVEKENIDLITEVVNWEEFSDLQLSFFKAGVPDIEIPSDHAIFILLYDIASKNNIKYIITGNNIVTESILPSKWSNGHTDWKYIKKIQKKFGSKKLTTYPFFSFRKIIKYNFFQNIKMIGLLNYVDYNKEEVFRLLEKEYLYKRYETKHGESIYTYFVQTYVLPERFGFDKRRSHYSSVICSNQMTREEALMKLQKKPLNQEEINELRGIVCEKLKISEEKLDEFMSLPLKYYDDYPNMNNKLWVFLKKIYMKLFIDFSSTRAVE